MSARSRPRPGSRVRVLLAALVVAALAGSGAACDLGNGGDEVDQPAAGGTLRLVLARWPTHLDPQRVAVAPEANLSKLINRTLTTFRAVPGGAGNELVADLATDTGRPSENNTIWEFTLKDGARWEDGEPVTCQDVKYGVERRFSRDEARQTGSTVPFQYLQDNEQQYEGPWVAGNNDGTGLESVECVDQRLIRYHLAKPVGDFNFAVSLPVFAPVRPGADDDRERYDQFPLATGPYRIAEHQVDADAPAENLLVLERNPQWSPATDPHRPAYPDRIVVEPTGDAAATANDLIHDQGEDRNRILLDTDIAPTFLQQVMTDPELSARVASGPMGAVHYLPVNTELIPEVECRQALAYAINKRKLRVALGGQLLGKLATAMIPPNLPAHLDFDHYGTREFPDGQPERALEVLAEAESAGIDCPTEISFAHPDDPQHRQLAASVVESYRRIGVQVRPVAIPLADYYTPDGVLGERAWELTWIGLAPPWPNGSAVIPGLFDGRISEPGSASYLNRFNDERINGLIDSAFAEGDLQRQYQLWGEIDSELMQQAVAIPVLYNNALRMHGSNVQGVFIHPQLAMPDVAAVGLADPTLSPPAEP